MLVSYEVFGPGLIRDKTVELAVVGLVDHPHAATAQRFNNALVGDGPADERIGSNIAPPILGCVSQVSQRNWPKLSTRELAS